MMMSDEVTTPISKETDGIRIMKGQQSSSNPKFGLWSGWSDQGRYGKESDTVMFSLKIFIMLLI